jgi:hypothetical protein
MVHCILKNRLQFTKKQKKNICLKQMSTLVNFNFDELSRIGNDSTAYTQENILNTNHANYMTYNPYTMDCKGALEFATSQPNIFIKGTNGIGPGGCNIAESTILEKSVLTNPHIKISLHERPYKTVPYLGKGNVDVSLENSLLWGDSLREKKSVVKLTENNCKGLDNYPLMNPDRMTNPRFHIESYASKDWVRGGVDTREMYKSKDYKKI